MILKVPKIKYAIIFIKTYNFYQNKLDCHSDLFIFSLHNQYKESIAIQQTFMECVVYAKSHIENNI